MNYCRPQLDSAKAHPIPSQTIEKLSESLYIATDSVVVDGVKTRYVIRSKYLILWI